MFASAKVVRHTCLSALLAFSLLSAAAYGQVQATLRAETGFPAGQSVAPTVPAGAVVIGSNLWTGDGFDGFRHWIPADPHNPDPINSGILVPDSTLGFSLGGGSACFLFCKVGQVAWDGSSNVYFASYDQLKGNGITFPGIWRAQPDPVTGEILSAQQLVPNAGLAGNLTTAIAIGPDGNLYVGFLKNGNVKRIVNPTGSNPIVQSVGTSPNGRPLRALAFVGRDLYLASKDSLSVIRNAVSTSCQGGCNGVAVADGFSGIDHVGLTTDGINRLYLAVNDQVWRYTISSGARTLVSNSGTEPNGTVLPFAFVGGHTNLLQLDRLGNLWVGDDPSDGVANFQGRIWYISAGALSSLP
jgi:hypothetical protein